MAGATSAFTRQQMRTCETTRDPSLLGGGKPCPEGLSPRVAQRARFKQPFMKRNDIWQKNRRSLWREEASSPTDMRLLISLVHIWERFHAAKDPAKPCSAFNTPTEEVGLCSRRSPSHPLGRQQSTNRQKEGHERLGKSNSYQKVAPTMQKRQRYADTNAQSLQAASP
jgi:hypothetical protein